MPCHRIRSATQIYPLPIIPSADADGTDLVIVFPSHDSTCGDQSDQIFLTGTETNQRTTSRAVWRLACEPDSVEDGGRRARRRGQQRMRVRSRSESSAAAV